MLVHPAPLRISPKFTPDGAEDDPRSSRPSASFRQINSFFGGRRRPIAQAMSPSPISIQLDSGEGIVVLRAGQQGLDGDNAVLSGKVTLRLDSQVAVRSVELAFQGRARTTFTESVAPFKSHHLDETIFDQSLSMLEAAGSAHTLSAGEHQWPFSLELPPELPASVAATSGTIEYRIKVTVHRPGFTTQNWVAKRLIHVHHGLRADAIEYSSSLDIENDWPGKVSYAFTIPSKAHAVGSSIPIHIKFVPHTKGVRVASLTTTIRENSTFYSKHHSANTARDVVVLRHDLTGCPGDTSPGVQPIDYQAPRAGHGPPPGPHLPRSPLNGVSGSSSASRRSPLSSAAPLPRDMVHPGELSRRLQSVSLPAGADEEDFSTTDINTVIRITVPQDAPPSHTRTPIVISHRIKWSALIQNPDGHTSELRCALPLHLLASDLAEEARLAASGATNLLFGPSGVLVPTNEEAAQVQLPSYPDHVHDRIANAQAASYVPAAGSFVPTAWAASARSSPAQTPLHTPSPSRPASPVLGHAPAPPHAAASTGSLTGLARQHERIDWADNELRGSLQNTPANSPPAIERPHPAWPEAATGKPSRTPSTNSESGNRFHLHLPKPLRSFTSLTSAHGWGSHDRLSGHTSPTATHPPAVGAANAQGLQPHNPTEEEEALMMTTPRRRVPEPLPTAEPEVSPQVNQDGDLGLDVLRQVPPYEVAERWLGGGVVPLESQRGLPDYGEQE